MLNTEVRINRKLLLCSRVLPLILWSYWVF